MANIKFKTISLSRIKFECHQDALKPYKLSKDNKYQYSNLSLSLKTFILLQSLDSINAVQITKNHYKFFTGWFWLSDIKTLGIDKISFFLHQDIKRSDIQKLAWTYLLANQLKMYHRNTNLAQMHDLIRSIPRVYQKQLFGDSYFYSASTVVENLSGETRSSIRNQKDKNSVKGILIDHISIKENLFGGK